MPCSNNSWSKLGAQAILLKILASRTGEGHSIQILSVATLQVKKKPLMDMLLVITDPNDPRWSQHFWSAPSFPLEAPGLCCSWRPPRRFCSAEAPQPRRGRSAPHRGAVWSLRRFRPRDDGSSGQLSSGSTNKKPINVLDSTASNCSKQKTFTNKLNKLQYMFLTFYNITADETMCNRKCSNNWSGHWLIDWLTCYLWSLVPTCFAIAGTKSLVIISSLDVQVQGYNTIDKEMLQSFVIESIHGTQMHPLHPCQNHPHKAVLAPYLHQLS